MESPTLESVMRDVTTLREQLPYLDIRFEVRLREADESEDKPTLTNGVMDNWAKAHRNDPPMPCDQCGRPFKQRDAKQRFCSYRCRRDSQNIDRLKVRQKVSCKQCGQEFKQGRSDQEYCSQKC
ncbi:MAG: hypothetical protein KGL39_53160, partial [Patescibacteria group bacterium]|nr:hypothetical protein [Patescibacteria group bacterium]